MLVRVAVVCVLLAFTCGDANAKRRRVGSSARSISAHELVELGRDGKLLLENAVEKCRWPANRLTLFAREIHKHKNLQEEKNARRHV